MLTLSESRHREAGALATALLLGACATTPQAEDPFLVRADCVSFERSESDANAVRSLGQIRDEDAARDLGRIESILAEASDGFRASGVAALARLALSQDRSSDAHRLLASACEQQSQLSSAARGEPTLVTLAALCGGRATPGVKPSRAAGMARKAISAWRRTGDERDLMQATQQITERLSLEGHPPPARMPYRPQQRFPLIMGVLLQLAGYDALVHLGATRTTYVMDTKQLYESMYSTQACRARRS